MIRAGILLIDELTQMGFPPVAALWVYTPETNYWKFLIASPGYDHEGPRKTYEYAQRALASLGDKTSDMKLTDIVAVSPDHRLIQALRTLPTTGDIRRPMRITQAVVGHTYIEDALVYKLS